MLQQIGSNRFHVFIASSGNILQLVHLYLFEIAISFAWSSCSLLYSRGGMQ